MICSMLLITLLTNNLIYFLFSAEPRTVAQSMFNFLWLIHSSLFLRQIPICQSIPAEIILCLSPCSLSRPGDPDFCFAKILNYYTLFVAVHAFAARRPGFLPRKNPKLIIPYPLAKNNPHFAPPPHGAVSLSHIIVNLTILFL